MAIINRINIGDSISTYDGHFTIDSKHGYREAAVTFYNDILNDDCDVIGYEEDHSTILSFDEIESYLKMWYGKRYSVVWNEDDDYD